jgi:hypothetical protein
MQIYLDSCDYEYSTRVMNYEYFNRLTPAVELLSVDLPLLLRQHTTILQANNLSFS